MQLERTTRAYNQSIQRDAKDVPKRGAKKRYAKEMPKRYKRAYNQRIQYIQYRKTAKTGAQQTGM